MKKNKKTFASKYAILALAISSTLSNLALASDAQTVTGTSLDCAGLLGCLPTAGNVDSVTVNTTTATSLNTSGSTNTAVGNSTGTTTMTGSTTNITATTDSAGTSAPALRIVGQNGSQVPNTTIGTYPDIPAGVGVLITGSGKANGPDVYLSSQNGKAAISITNTGVTIISPAGTSGSTINVSSTNNYGQQGAYNTGSVTNNFGNGNANSTGNVTNTIGTSVAGGGTLTNTVGGGSGTSTNNFGNSTDPGASSTNTLGSAVAGSTSSNSIGGGAGQTTNSIGNSNILSTVAMQAGNSASNLANGVNTATTTGSLASGVGGSNISGATGYTSTTSGAVLKDGVGTYATVDANGKLGVTTGTATESSINMTITNGIGNTHGLVVNETQATLSGGTRSSSMTLNDNGATFSNSATGAPIQVHGVANGTAPTDAVNVRQMRSGVASASALAGLPALDTNKDFSLAIAGANYQGYQAAAVGLSARINKQLVVRAATSTSYNGGATNIGVGYSW